MWSEDYVVAFPVCFILNYNELLLLKKKHTMVKMRYANGSGNIFWILSGRV